MKFKIKRKKYNIKGNLAWEYNPFHNLVKDESKVLDSFDTDELIFDTRHPVDITCQTSYDGSTNIILNDDLNAPKIINSGFSIKENNTYEKIIRNQAAQTNVYRENSIEQETRLQRVSSKFLQIDLEKVHTGGELQGGNYTFLFRYVDDDSNYSKVIAESGIVSIFHGSIGHPHSIHGTLSNERTNKQIVLKLSNIDYTYSKLNISYKREYSDTNGIKMVEYKSLIRPIEIKDNSDSTMCITIDGREAIYDISYADLTSEPNVYNKVKTQVQNQNLLFFGNVEQHVDDIEKLQMLSLYVGVKSTFGPEIGYVDPVNFSGIDGEYFNPHNIYYNLGYMPEEFYRLGIVYVYDNDVYSSVYNLRGCVFTSVNSWNISEFDPKNEELNVNDTFISGTDNTKGIFKMPSATLLSKSNRFRPLIFEFFLSDTIKQELKTLGIKGYFIVRQPRIPIFLTQAASIGISDCAYIPILSSYEDSEEGEIVSFHTTSPLCKTKDSIEIKRNTVHFTREEDGAPKCFINGLISLDILYNPQLQSIFNGESFVLKNVGKWNCVVSDRSKIVHINTTYEDGNNFVDRYLLYIPRETSYRGYKNKVFSTKAGSSEDVLSIRSLKSKTDFYIDDYCIRGQYMPYIGVVSSDELENALSPNTVYNVYTQSYCRTEDDVKVQMTNRAFDKTNYFAICGITELDTNVKCARGDCFTCTSASTFQYNYLDLQTPLNEIVVKSIIEKKDSKDSLFTKTYGNMPVEDWGRFNTSDLNAVDIGHIITFKYMSNYNCVRSIDSSHVDELAMFGQPRAFYPHVKDVTGVPFKINDSAISNAGLSATSTFYPYFEVEQVPYIKRIFDTRIGYSNISSNESFSNGYRVFSNIAYKDLERTYGAITKLIAYGADLFCVFEHGCGLIPINQKALLSTTTGQSIQLSGSDIIQSQISVISQDYGSIWKDSIVVTPNAIYGVDSFAKKIWRYTAKGFELISDQIVQRFLNDNILLSETDVFPTIGIKNIKTHYNAYKGDVMFTFYNNDKCWNLCYNERVDKFITKYSWTPLVSSNIQNSFVSIDRYSALPYLNIAHNQIIDNALRLDGTSDMYRYKYRIEDIPYLHEVESETSDTVYYEKACKVRREFKLVGMNDMYNGVEAKILSISYPKWNSEQNKIEIITHNSTDSNGMYIPLSDRTYEYKSEDGISQTVEKEVAYAASLIGWGEKRTLSAERPLPADCYAEDALNENDYDEDIAARINNFKAQYANYVSCALGGALEVELKLSEFISWIQIEVEVIPYKFDLDNSDIDDDDVFSFGTKTTRQKGTPFTQTLMLVADYDDVKYALQSLKEKEQLENSNDLQKIVDGCPKYGTTEEYEKYLEECDNILRIGLYTHGRAGIYDELNYFDDDPDNQIKPTFWYNRQEPFEFEFVVNSPSGLQKIFDNLVIISNNAEPNTLEFSLIGDAYNFNKSGIFSADNTQHIREESGLINTDKTILEKLKKEFNNMTNKVSEIFKGLFNNSQIIYSTSIEKDPILNEFSLKVSENCRNAANVGRCLGNIEYREDKWLVNISPIYFKRHKWDGNSLTTTSSNLQSTKLRDKWVKIRIKYTGDKLVVLSAIQTLMTISYS